MAFGEALTCSHTSKDFLLVLAWTKSTNLQEPHTEQNAAR